MIIITEKIVKTVAAVVALILSALLINMFMSAGNEMPLWYAVAGAAHAIPIGLIVFQFTR